MVITWVAFSINFLPLNSQYVYTPRISVWISLFSIFQPPKVSYFGLLRKIHQLRKSTCINFNSSCTSGSSYIPPPCAWKRTVFFSPNFYFSILSHFIWNYFSSRSSSCCTIHCRLTYILSCLKFHDAFLFIWHLPRISVHSPSHGIFLLFRPPFPASFCRPWSYISFTRCDFLLTCSPLPLSRN